MQVSLNENFGDSYLAATEKIGCEDLVRNYILLRIIYEKDAR